MAYDLYNGLPPHERGFTSTAAAVEISPFVNTLQQRVLAWITSQSEYGATVDEVEVALGMLHQTASARVRELVQLERLALNGQTRRTRSGRRAAVAVAVSPAVAVQVALF